jgi:hypothetical protein
MAVPTARKEPPVTRARSRGALVYTVQDLDQKSARIMSQIEETREPAFIIRDGRFVAIIQPLALGQVESRALRAMARQAAKRG